MLMTLRANVVNYYLNGLKDSEEMEMSRSLVAEEMEEADKDQMEDWLDYWVNY